MSMILSPVILFAGLALGALGVAVAMPRRGVNPQIIGAIIAGTAVGLVLIALGVIGVRSGEGLPGVFFYVFALTGLGSALRVITHQRPVYAALYFVLTIISSAGLFLLLAAEFMTFAIVIIYAGAILITYLFVIMLATEAPTEETLEALSDYDARSREPIAATLVGFTLLAALSGMLAAGVPGLGAPEASRGPIALERMPGKVQNFIAALGVGDDVMPAAFMPADLGAGLETAARREVILGWNRSHSPVVLSRAAGEGAIGFIQLVPRDPDSFRARLDAARAGERPAGVRPLPAALVELLPDESTGLPAFIDADPPFVMIRLPVSVAPTNIETVGLTLVGEHPLSLELAGVILLLAMVGAVVLARKQTEIEEARKAAVDSRLRLGGEGGAA